MGQNLEAYAYVDRLDLTEISIPKGTERIGRYAFYNCRNLEKLTFFSDIKDWGSGVFTGCHRIHTLEVTMVPDQVSCLRDVLMELSEELLVILHGEVEARLHMPLYYEDSEENTPARILVIKTYGSGKQYRNCFVNRCLQFDEYDRCFVNAKAHESADFLTRLAFDRLWYPHQLSDRARGEYQAYLAEHQAELWAYLLEEKQVEMVKAYLEIFKPDEERLSRLTELAAGNGYAEATPYLMEYRRTHFAKKKRSFQLDF